MNRWIHSKRSILVEVTIALYWTDGCWMDIGWILVSSCWSQPCIQVVYCSPDKVISLVEWLRYPWPNPSLAPAKSFPLALNNGEFLENNGSLYNDGLSNSERNDVGDGWWLTRFFPMIVLLITPGSHLTERLTQHCCSTLSRLATAFGDSRWQYLCSWNVSPR